MSLICFQFIIVVGNYIGDNNNFINLFNHSFQLLFQSVLTHISSRHSDMTINMKDLLP